MSIEQIREILSGRHQIVIYDKDFCDIKQTRANNPQILDLTLYQAQSGFVHNTLRVPAGSFLLVTERAKDNYERNNTLQQNATPVKGSKTVKAFVLPFSENHAHHISVPNLPDVQLIVTTLLTGCTVTAETNTATPTLYHYNLRRRQEGRDLINQTEIDYQIQQKYGDTPANLFTVKKSDYAPEIIPRGSYCTYSANFMGFKTDNGTWDYVTQYSLYDGHRKEFHVRRGKRSINNHSFTPQDDGDMPLETYFAKSQPQSNTLFYVIGGTILLSAVAYYGRDMLSQGISSLFKLANKK